MNPSCIWLHAASPNTVLMLDAFDDISHAIGRSTKGKRCVAVAKLSKALAWLSCVRSRERPEFRA